MFFVHEMTSRLARTLKIGTGKLFCIMNPKITFKTSKNQLLLGYCTGLPKFGCETTKPQRSMWHYWKIEIFFLHVLRSSNFLSSKNKVLFSAIGIWKKIGRQFYFHFCCCKGQIRWYYNNKHF